MYFYRGHLSGELYSSDEFLDYEDLYCETCGDSDEYIGYAETKEEAWSLLLGGLDYERVKNFIDECFEE